MRTTITGKEALEIFEDVFYDHSSTAVMTCECGKTYYCPNDGFDFDEGELERLEKDPDAFAVDCVSPMTLFKQRFVCECGCYKQDPGVIFFINIMAGYMDRVVEFLVKVYGHEADNIRDMADVMDKLEAVNAIVKKVTAEKFAARKLRDG